MSRATVGMALFLFVGLSGALPGYAQNRPSRFDTKLTPPGPHDIIFKGGPYSDKLLIDKYLVPVKSSFAEAAKQRPAVAVWNGLPLALPQETETLETSLPADAVELLQGMETDIAEIHKKADEEKRQRRERALSLLKDLQDKYTREAKLDEAVAIRDRIRRLKRADLPVFRDPGSLYQLHGQIGRSFLFEVVGDVNGSLWGTEVYTGDSALAAAAVHMGILKPGQKGIVKATIIASPAEHKSSTQNGVTSASYGPYSFSYTIEPYREAPAKPQ